MRTTRFLLVTLTATAAALALGTASASAASNWQKYGGDCDDAAFKSPDTADIKVIARCVRMWEAYQDVSEVKDDGYRGRVISAMQRLYVQGTDKDASVARVALGRLGVTALPDRGGETTAKAEKTDAKKPARERFNPEEPTKKQKAAADKHFKNGFKQYQKKKYDKALSYYLKMVDAAPGYAKGHYNAACAYALLGDADNMNKYLQNLADMAAGGSDDAMKNLKLARTDSDFEGVRDGSTEFKRLTGYAKVKVLNAMGEMGEENTDNLMASLKKLNYVADGVDESSKKRTNPIIWYAEHSKGAAYIVKELLGHPKTQVVLFTVEQLKGFDVVVVWGDEVKKNGEPKVYVQDPADAEKKLDQLARKEDEILREPEAVADEIDDALGKPEEVQERIDKNLERPGKAIDRAEKTVDKVKGLFK
ncbi:MAG: hypothetical protein EP329_12865 [Deltaproteobacteria bacterium]|nr:MAG: hypothetical protein EP329_12865 [Deltaproteobacteria bacterium]